MQPYNRPIYRAQEEEPMSVNAQANPFTPPAASLDGGDVETETETEFRLNLFSPQGRIGRVRYLLYSFALGFPIGIVGMILSMFIGIPGVLLLYIALFYVNIMLTIKRSHDFNVSGWLSLLLFVPLGSLIFLFVPGTDGANRFGRKPAPNGRSGLVLVLVMVGGIFLIGILAAVIIPSYQDYQHRVEAMEQQRR